MKKRDYKSHIYSLNHFFALHTTKIVVAVFVLLIGFVGFVWGSLDPEPKNTKTTSFRPIVCSSANIVKEVAESEESDPSVQNEKPFSKVVCTSFTGIIPRGVIKKASLHIDWKTRTSENLQEQKNDIDINQKEEEKNTEDIIQQNDTSSDPNNIETEESLSVDKSEQADKQDTETETSLFDAKNDSVLLQGRQMIANTSSYKGVFVIDDENKKEDKPISDESALSPVNIEETVVLPTEDQIEKTNSEQTKDNNVSEPNGEKQENLLDVIQDENQLDNKTPTEEPNTNTGVNDQQEQAVILDKSNISINSDKDLSEEKNTSLEEGANEVAFLYYSFDGKTDLEIGPVYEKNGFIESDFLLPLKTFWDMKRLSVSFVVSDYAIEKNLELVVDGVRIDVEYEEINGDITPGIDTSFYNVIDVKNINDNQDVYVLDTIEEKKELWIALKNTDETQWQKIADEEILNFNVSFEVLDNLLFWVGPENGSIVVFDFLTNTIVSQTIESDQERNIFRINGMDYKFFINEKSLLIEKVPNTEENINEN